MPQPVDHSRYMDAARSFPSRPPNPIFDHQYLRIGLTAPTALVMKVFGYSEATYHAFPVAAALLLFGSVYAIGRLLFGRLVGAVSAVVLGCVGIVVVAGTELLPDLPATALFTAAVALTVALRRGLLRHRRVWLVVIGVLLGWSYLVREFIVFVWPLVPVLLWRRIGRRDSLFLVTPVVLTGAGETAFNAWLYGDPLARLHAGSGLGDLPSRPEVAKTFHDLPLWVYLWRLPQQLATLPEGPGLLLLLALTLAAGAVCAVRLVRAWRGGAQAGPDTRRAGVFALWIALLWVPLTLLGGVLNPAHPKLRLQLLRYWYPVFPAFVLGGVAALWLLGRAVRRSPRALVPAVAVCSVALLTTGLAVLGRPGTPGWAGSPRVSSDALPEFRSWLARSGAQTVWADTKLYRVLPIYFVSRTGHRVWRGHLRPLTNATGPVAGDYVVAYSVGSDACPRCGDAAKAALPGIPSTWRPVLTTHDHLLHVWQVG
ncbi:glycosyltransferase family 39 protein [Actinoallomurus sp. NPDC052274]|uniref:glycosyltransferase family 39 protein n=1 Tax=Actinoallomurus sp. NPDC052274 TaxID=3155420 RepID=UPI0034279C54